MHLREVIYKNQKSLIIYLTETEIKDINIKEKIIEYKKEYLNVTVFLSGSRSIENVLKAMVQKRM
ncbi:MULTISPECIES: hypothetical protein [Clostridium]|uniref:hypothetical protein n=1 Tax=Clostridium TaxID=1485 RepID=UPI000826897F|nr:MULTISPECIES: hypothetical protein [Clostridium]PJI09787.1 hypothetical protein CUB90_18780 [Clostridium sp. CT7]